ncbi:MAG: hypothetical protein U0271_06160 [Polyangiaceae bacterium]
MSGLVVLRSVVGPALGVGASVLLAASALVGCSGDATVTASGSNQTSAKASASTKAAASATTVVPTNALVDSASATSASATPSSTPSATPSSSAAVAPPTSTPTTKPTTQPTHPPGLTARPGTTRGPQPKVGIVAAPGFAPARLKTVEHVFGAADATERPTRITRHTTDSSRVSWRVGPARGLV